MKLLEHEFWQNSLREKCLNTEFLLVRIFLYSVQTQENANQEKTPHFDTFHVVID